MKTDEAKVRFLELRTKIKRGEREEADCDGDEEEGDDDDDDDDGGGGGGGGHIVYEPTGDRAMEDLRDNITNEYGRATTSVKRTTQKSVSCGSGSDSVNFLRLINEQQSATAAAAATASASVKRTTIIVIDAAAAVDATAAATAETCGNQTNRASVSDKTMFAVEAISIFFFLLLSEISSSGDEEGGGAGGGGAAYGVRSP
ncbi:hypothetical protein Bca4012_010246 [Brassica carinata]